MYFLALKYSCVGSHGELMIIEGTVGPKVYTVVF